MSDRVIKPVLSHQVFKWPEFIALADRLGIDMTNRTRTLVMVFDSQKMPVIDHSFAGDDNKKAAE